MNNLNIDFLMSGSQFNSKLKEKSLNNKDKNDPSLKCVWSARNSKSNNFYQIKEEISKLKNSSK